MIGPNVIEAGANLRPNGETTPPPQRPADDFPAAHNLLDDHVHTALSIYGYKWEDLLKVGMFSYTHIGPEDGGTMGSMGPYLRDRAPSDPVTVDRLPAHLRAIVESARFEHLSFLDCPLIQPLEHFDCGEGEILSADGRKLLRATPGQCSTNFEDRQQAWDQSVRNCELRREQALRDLARWPEPTGEDFPAAHSGDVQWFAVDPQGHVATFYAWSTAPIPITFRDLPIAATTFWDCLERLRAEGVHSKSIVELDGALHLLNDFSGWYGVNRIETGSHGGWGLPAHEVRRKRLGRVLMIVQSLDVVQPALDAGLATLALQRPAGPPYVVDFADLPRELAEQILRSGQCVSCISRNLTDVNDDQVGVFHYNHIYHEGGYSGFWRGPYCRDTAPADPLTVDRLPSEVRAIVEQVCFEHVSFLDRPLIQPLEHFDCRGAEQWGAYVQSDGRTLRVMPGESPDLEAAQQEWDECLRRIEQEREQHLREQVTWPQRKIATAARRRPAPPQSWRQRVIFQIEDYRDANPTDLVPDLVRVALEFPNDDVALEVYRQSLREPFSDEIRLRGACVVFYDAPADPGMKFNEHAPAEAYRWLNECIQTGRFPEPRVILGRPPLRPPGDELRRLFDDLSELRSRCAQIVEDRVPARKLRRRLEAAPQHDVWETLVALLLSCTGADFESLPDYYRDVPSSYLNRVARLAPLLTEAKREDWQLLERIVEHLPLEPAVQDLRVQVLSLAAATGSIPADELQAALRLIFEGRDDDLFGEDRLQLLERAFEAPGLPVAVLRQTIRAALAATEEQLALDPDDLAEQPAIARLQELLKHNRSLAQRRATSIEDRVRKWFEQAPRGADRKTFALWVQAHVPADLHVALFELLDNKS